MTCGSRLVPEHTLLTSHRTRKAKSGVAPPRQTQAHTPRYRSHESPTTAPALTVAQRHRKAPRSAVQPTAGDRAVVLLGWPCIAQQKQPQGLSSGQVERSEFERRLACQKARCSRAEQWVSYSCTGVQPFGVAPRGTSQTCRPGGSPGRSYGVILWLRRGVAPCEVRAAMTARSVCPLLRTELGTCGPVASGTRPGFSRIVWLSRWSVIAGAAADTVRHKRQGHSPPTLGSRLACTRAPTARDTLTHTGLSSTCSTSLHSIPQAQQATESRSPVAVN